MVAHPAERRAGMKATPSRRRFMTGAAASSLLLMPRATRADAADWDAGAPPDWDRVMEAAKAEGEITVAANALLTESVKLSFQLDTGIQVNFIGGDNAERAAQFVNEARSKKPTIDILIDDGRGLTQMMKEGLLAKVAPQIMLPGVAASNFRGGSIKWVDDAKLYALQGSECVFGWVVVNRNFDSPAEIDHWQKLLDPKWKGKIAAPDPRTPGPGQDVAVWLYQVLGIDYIKKLYVGQEVSFVPDDRDLIEGVARGAPPIALGTVQSEIERLKADGVTILGVVLPDDHPGYLTAGSSVLQEPVGAPHPNAATAFINWFISYPCQAVYERVMLEPSRRTDVHTGLPDYLIPRAGVSYYDAATEAAFAAHDGAVKAIADALAGR
jgi:ABC-type Fe3+ transport system substrate-binding protein